LKEEYNKTIEHLQSKIAELMTEHKITGMGIALIREREIIWSEAFGLKDVERNLPMTKDSLYAAASLTKPFAAFIAMKLYEEGKLDIDKSLESYLPKPYVKDRPEIKQITARHVMCHTSGLPNWGEIRYQPKVFFTPGERFSYSNEGYDYLGRVMEVITNKSLEGLFQEYIAKPLNFKDASLLWQDDFDEKVALGYLKDGKIRTWKPNHPYACGSLFISPEDCARFLISFMDGQPKSNYRLKEELLELMLSPAIPVNNAGLGNQHTKPFSEITLSEEVFWSLGWSLEKNNSKYNFWHWGNNNRFQNLAIANRLGEGLVLMSNKEGAIFTWNEILNIAIPGHHPGLIWLDGF
jgi:CubicO group peptidase (beta-lactamase class C family)